MISEVDIRDWQDQIRIARTALKQIVSTVPITAAPENFLQHFIDRVEALVTMNQKQIPALFKANKPSLPSWFENGKFPTTATHWKSNKEDND